MSPHTQKEISIKKKVIEHCLDRRDAMKQIITGYPEIQKMTTLELNDYNDDLEKLDSSRINNKLRESSISKHSNSARK